VQVELVTDNNKIYDQLSQCLVTTYYIVSPHSLRKMTTVIHRVYVSYQKYICSCPFPNRRNLCVTVQLLRTAQSSTWGPGMYTPKNQV